MNDVVNEWMTKAEGDFVPGAGDLGLDQLPNLLGREILPPDALREFATLVGILDGHQFDSFYRSECSDMFELRRFKRPSLHENFSSQE